MRYLELHHAHLDLKTLRKQAQQTNLTYDELMTEHEKLQKHVAKLEAELAGGAGAEPELKKDS